MVNQQFAALEERGSGRVSSPKIPLAEVSDTTAP